MKLLNNSERGLFCEYLVFKKYLNLKYVFISHRFRTPVGEVDLLFFDPKSQNAVAIEVKASSSDDFLFARVGARQKTKLRAICKFLERRYLRIQMLLAIVSHDASIEVIENFLS